MSRLQSLFAATPADFGLLVIRLYVGAALALAHGLGKVTNLPAFIEGIGAKVPFPALLGPAAAFSEFLGGLLLAVGLFTRPAAFFVLVTMLVAGFHIHDNDPFFKKELAFAYAAVALGIVFAGAGRLSIDGRAAGEV
jgi:putative oxidoreductase